MNRYPELQILMYCTFFLCHLGSSFGFILDLCVSAHNQGPLAAGSASSSRRLPFSNMKHREARINQPYGVSPKRPYITFFYLNSR
jgi:hypothetical protein